MTTKICPKCGSENPDYAMKCLKCHTNLMMTLEDAAAQDIYESSLIKSALLIILEILIGGVAGLVGSFSRYSHVWRELGNPFSDFVIFLPMPCIPIAPLAGIISAITVHFILKVDEDRKIPVLGRVIIIAIIGFLAGFPFVFISE